MTSRRESAGLRRCPHRHDDGRKNEVVVVFVLTGFGDADTSSEIRGLELRPELMPRAFPFVAARRGQLDGVSARLAALAQSGARHS